MEKSILVVAIMLALAGNSFAMGFFPQVAPVLPAASTDGKNDWKARVDSSNSTVGPMFYVYSASDNASYAAFPKSGDALKDTNIQKDGSATSTSVDYNSFWNTFGGLF